ncbi:MAG: M48 family metallopeptidase [Spirosomaceae bacterium]|jgi:predicted Zn-dependent protease|nr:M48 family metallopeptidase [Spirosomataceae bacterium]
MKTFLKSSTLAVALIALVIACTRVPITGRKQLSLISNAQIMGMSFTSYKEFLDSNKVVSNGKDAEMIRRVGNRIKTAVENYLIQNNYSQVIDGYQWQFELVQSKDLNAWCMPGGKVVFYTGILPICQNEEGVAVVMGHEIAHAIASHGAERMSQAYVAQGITTAAAVGGMIATKNEQNGQIIGQVVGAITTGAYVLPNSRKQESEADKLGLIFMAMAGYNPQNSVEFWQRMAKAGQGGQKPPQWLSTHPSDETRISNLNALMPKAMAYYQAYNK